jgi:lysophospholipase L1-like esterase
MKKRISLLLAICLLLLSACDTTELTIADNSVPQAGTADLLEYTVSTPAPPEITAEPLAEAEFDGVTLLLGDSLTYGFGMLHGSERRVFAGRVGLTTKEAANELLRIFDADPAERWHTAKELLISVKPDRVYILLGTNDIGSDEDTWLSRYSDFISEIKAVTAAGISLTSIPPTRIRNADYIEARNAVLKALADELNLGWLDILYAACCARARR